MRVPRGRGAEIAVLVGHGDVGLAGSEGGHLEGHTGEVRGTVIGLFRELDIGAVDLLGNLRDVVSTNGICGRILLNLLERHIVGLHIACGCLGLTNDDSTARNTDIILPIVEEGIA